MQRGGVCMTQQTTPSGKLLAKTISPTPAWLIQADGNPSTRNSVLVTQ